MGRPGHPSASRTARRVRKQHLSLFSRSRPSRTGTTSSDGLFAEESRDYIRERFRALLRPQRHEPFGGGPRTPVELGRIVAHMARAAFDTRSTVTVARSGAVAVSASLNRPADDGPLGIGLLVEDVIEPAWTVAADIVERLDGSGSSVAFIRTTGSRTWHTRGRTATSAARLSGSGRSRRARCRTSSSTYSDDYCARRDLRSGGASAAPGTDARAVGAAAARSRLAR